MAEMGETRESEKVLQISLSPNSEVADLEGNNPVILIVD
jgi:hypothetical protein